MYPTHKWYTNCTLFVCLLFCIRILNVWAEPKTEFISHKNVSNIDFDVTTIYKITNISALNSNDTGFKNKNGNTVCNGCDLIEIHSKTNSIGLPLQNDFRILKTNIKELFYNGSFNEYILFSNISKNTENGIMNYDDINYHTLEWGDFEYSSGSFVCCENMNGRNYYFTNFLTLEWVPRKYQTCVTMTYTLNQMHSYYYDYKVYVKIYDSYNISDVGVHIALEESDEIKTLKVTNLNEYNNYGMSIDIYRPTVYGLSDGKNSFVFKVLRIAQCNNEDEEEIRIISTKDDFLPKPFRIIGSDIPVRKSSKLCLNGGWLQKATLSDDKCICPPGFKGQFCETGCGPNLYGVDCTGVCSMKSSEQCRGMLMCTSYGCTCPVGLTGQMCSNNCESGKYGANCEQTCSSKCFDNKCDQYTGKCSHGCTIGYVPPNCEERYPYLIEPPTLISNTFDTIKLKLNFNSTNSGGDKHIGLKYYQLYYKLSNEDSFTNSELKVISEHSNGTTEILSDLKPDNLYEVGVLVITSDGNFNDRDIVYGHYRTSCIQPLIIDYNIELIPGVKNVNITWNKIITKKFECKVREYVLTLTLNQSKNEIYGIKEILSMSDSGHLIDDLNPGYRYTVTMTPKTSNGPLLESSTYSFSPFMPQEDVEIIDIVTTTDYDKIKVSWKLGSSIHPSNTLVKTPVTCILSYKLNRIFSCSLKEIENSNWTSIQIYNQTNYEIFDIVPNSQYYIKFGVLRSTVQPENMVYFYTPPSNPQTKPEIDINQPILVTNNSVNVQWNTDLINCTQLNGFFSKYYIELKDKSSNILQIKETKQNYISFDNLNSNTSYEMKVFIKTHIGYNSEHYLLVNFTTKLENLNSVDELMVYKKSIKSRMIGLRWSFISENTALNGFFVSFNEHLTNDSVILPNKCSGWPDYYCHTFNNLNLNKYHDKPYTFKIKPVTRDYPDGGMVSSISFNANDGPPDSPVNVKAQYVGNTTVTLQWDIPWLFNCVLKMFVINVEVISPLDNENMVDDINPIEIQIDEELPTYNYTISNLKAGYTYSFGVLTVSKTLWYSAPARITVTTLSESN